MILQSDCYHQVIILLLHAMESSSDQFTIELCWKRHNMISSLWQTFVKIKCLSAELSRVPSEFSIALKVSKRDFSLTASLRKKCPNLELFWIVFFHIRTKYREIQNISSVRMQENTDQNISVYEHFSRSAYNQKTLESIIYV